MGPASLGCPGDVAHRATGPRGPEPLLPPRGHQADPRHLTAGVGADRHGRATGATDRAPGCAAGGARHGVPPALRAAGRRAAGPGDRARVGRGPARRTGPAHLRPARRRRRLPLAAPRPSRGDGSRGRGGPRRRAGCRRGGGGRARRRAGRRVPRGSGAAHDHPDDPRGRGHRHQRQDHDEPDDRPHRPDRRQGGGLVEHRRHLSRRRARGGRRLLRSERCRDRAGVCRGWSSPSPRPRGAGSCSKGSG